MQPRSLGASALALAGLLAIPGLAFAQATDWKQIKKPPLRPFTPPQPVRVALPNGMVLFLQENHELPLIGGFARIRGGSREEPGEKTGLASLYGQAWRTGGTKGRTGDALDDFLEARAAKVETGGSLDSTNVSFDCLKVNFEEVFPVFLELLREPEFRDDKIALARNQLNTGIARRNDNPQAIAFREARKLGYGADSPYGRVEEYATVAAVTRDDLLGWHKAYVHPNNVVFGMVGDFDAKAMEARLRKAFASWPKGPAAAKVKAAFADPRPGVYFVQKDEVNQSNIRLLHLGTTRDNPDYYALEVMNEVFGGGFSARLFSNIRSKKGLAYNVGGGVGMNYDHPGLFMLSMGTKSESTAAAIDALHEEIDNLMKTPATAEELQRARDAILNSFIFNFDTAGEVLRAKMQYEFYGYPLDFLERYRAGIEKVTAEDVARVARQYVHKDKLAVLVVGKAADFDKPLSTFGAVTALDVTIPEGAPKKAAAAGSDAEGKALLAKVVEGLGGASAVQGVKAFRQKTSARMKGPQGDVAMEIDSLTVMPDRMHQQLQTPTGPVTLVISPQGSFMSLPVGTREMPASQRDNALKELKTHPLYVAQHADDPRLSVRAAGSDKVGDVDARVLELSVDGAETRWLVDPASGRVLRSVSRTTGGGAPAEVAIDFSDFKTISGLTIPFKRTVKRNGEDAGAMDVQEVVINPPVDPKTFEKPPEKPPGN
jgi:zinc protease